MGLVETGSDMICNCSNSVVSSGLEAWLPPIISIITLVVTMVFYIFIQPRITDRTSAKNDLKTVSISLLNYLTDIVSYKEFDGVPTKIRQYSLQIHLCFKSGIADPEIEKLLESIFQLTKERKTIVDSDEIKKWNAELKSKAHDLRVELAKHCGSL